jgi:hypothetical protein
MSELITAQRRTVRIYAAGGTGANILRAYQDNSPKHTHLLGDEQYAFVDTSLSNLVGVSADKVYHVKRPDGTVMDGAGGDRKAVGAAVLAAMPDITSKFQPGDKNIIVTSLTGGTGPAIAQIMVKYLHQKGHHCAILAVSSNESYKRVDNFIRTLTGMEDTTRTTGRPIVIALHKNDESKSRDANNVGPTFDLAAMSILFSGMNESMDTADVNNVFDYHTVTHFGPGVALLHIAADVNKFKDLEMPIAAYAAVARDRNETIPKLNSVYDTAGYMRNNEGDVYANSFYFAVSTASAASLFKDLIKQRTDLEQQQQVKAPVVSLLGGSGKADDETGLF